MRSLKRLILNNLLVTFVASVGLADQMASPGSVYVITKDLWGATGNISMTSADYSLAFAWGEQISGNMTSKAPYTNMSGYIGGSSFGNSQTIQLLSSRVGAVGVKTFFQGQLQVGIPFNAPVQLTFSSQLDVTTIANGIQVILAMDHLGHASNMSVPYHVDTTSNTIGHSITLTPQGSWLGNSLYDVQITPQLTDIDGFPIDQVEHIYFVTLLDHSQENVVLNPVAPAGISAGIGSSSIGAMTIDIPTESLSDFSTVLISLDPVSAPLQVNPKIIQEANDKARAAGGLYRVPIAIQEISAYNAQGNLMGPLSKPAQITLNYDAGSSAFGSGSNLIRPQTLALWALDQTHSLWVKIPASQSAAGFHTVTAPVTSFSVFALMGSADGSASDTFAFPVPWRPHGPNAGTNSGQSGSEADGITFSNLPSECSIKIYSIAGDLVRQIQHSDTGGLIGQEKWDVKTTHGDKAASGVYLWRVESSVDGKNGKLMVIR